jgi:type IV secretion system protein VirD4
MSKTGKYLTLAVLGLLFLGGFAAGGMYAGARLFAHLQNIPSEAATLTTLPDYWAEFGHIREVKKSLFLGVLAAAAVFLVPVAIVVMVLMSGPGRKLHGAARWATKGEIHKAGLLGKPSGKWPAIIVGKIGDQFLRYYGKEFLSLASATQGGKGVGCVIPNLLSYPHSLINLDLKLENWKITSGFRSQNGQECFLFAPGQEDFRSHRFNPLAYIRPEYEYRISDIQNQAVLWYPIKSEKDRFFTGNAQTLFMGLCLYMMETPDEQVSMPNLLSLATPSTGEPLGKWIEATIQAREQKDSAAPRLSVECVDALRTYSGLSEKAQGDILGTFVEPMKIFRDPVLAAATAGNDFDLRQIRRKKMSVYIGMTAEDLVRYSVLMNVFFSIAINLNTKSLPEDDPTLKYQCMLLLDEFTALGRITIIRKAIAIMAAFNMRLVLIYQNNSQIAGQEDGYGTEGSQTLLSNCTTKLLYQPDDLKDAEEYSKLLGYDTVKSKSRTRQLDKAGRSENESDQKRALLLPQELRELGFKKVIVLKKNAKPILADKIIYYEDPAFEGRISLPPPPVPVLSIVRTTHRDRALLPEELATTEAEDIVNSREILSAISEAIGFDFAAFEAGVVEDDDENTLAIAA